MGTAVLAGFLQWVVALSVDLARRGCGAEASLSGSAVTIGVLGGLGLVEGGWLLAVVLAAVGASCVGAWRLVDSARR